jgi:hypothetical protein
LDFLFGVTGRWVDGGSGCALVFDFGLLGDREVLGRGTEGWTSGVDVLRRGVNVAVLGCDGDSGLPVLAFVGVEGVFEPCLSWRWTTDDTTFTIVCAFCYNGSVLDVDLCVNVPCVRFLVSLSLSGDLNTGNALLRLMLVVVLVVVVFAVMFTLSLWLTLSTVDADLFFTSVVLGAVFDLLDLLDLLFLVEALFPAVRGD